MRILNRIRAAILFTKARQLQSVDQAGRALETMIAAYSLLGEPPPSSMVPLEFNLSLAVMAAIANRYGLVRDALALVEDQLPTDRTLSDPDRRYVRAYIKALRLFCDGTSWAAALSDSDVVAGARPKGVQRHLRLNFPLA